MPPFYMKNCEYCKKEYRQNKKKQRFCGKSCSFKFTRLKHPNWKTNLGKKFPNQSGNNNCMKKPEVLAKLSLALKGRNLYWAQKIADSRKRNGYKPSKETRLKQSKSHKLRVELGLHNNYKGGIEKENDRVRKSLEYKFWREEVFKRDDYTCQKCATRGGDLEADHVLPFCDYPDLRLEVLNGRTLCKTCHKNITVEQMKLIWRNQYATKV